MSIHEAPAALHDMAFTQGDSVLVNHDTLSSDLYLFFPDCKLIDHSASTPVSGYLFTQKRKTLEGTLEFLRRCRQRIHSRLNKKQRSHTLQSDGTTAVRGQLPCCVKNQRSHTLKQRATATEEQTTGEGALYCCVPRRGPM